MFKGEVVSAKKSDVTGEIIVQLLITAEDQDDVIRSLAFPGDIKEEDLKEELKKYVETYESDYELMLKDKVKQEADKKTDETIKSIENLKI